MLHVVKQVDDHRLHRSTDQRHRSRRAVWHVLLCASQSQLPLITVLSMPQDYGRVNLL